LFALQRLYHFIRMAGSKAADRLEDFAQEGNLGGRVKKSDRVAEYPVHGLVNVGLIGQWFIPGIVRMRFVVPGRACDAFDRLHGHVALAADLQQRFDVGRILSIL
jgi:hypothetical protein